MNSHSQSITVTPVMRFIFNARKSAQAAAVLLKLNGGDMDKYLFIKMLYLSDRAAIAKWEEPITGDSAASMQYGPVLSAIYDLTKGDCPSARGDWAPFISDSDEQTNRISLLQDPGTSELSRAEITILESVFEKFNEFTWKQMRDHCHDLREYEDVGKTSKPIATERILSALGKS
ncbi:MAG: Panacea domain-containing protein, partial [Phycisphaerae bacterium]